MAELMADPKAGSGVPTLILGAGSADCVLATRLSMAPRRQVLLLDAGGTPPRESDIPANWPLMFNTAVDWGFHTVPQVHCQGRRLFGPRGKMPGGSGSLLQRPARQGRLWLQSADALVSPLIDPAYFSDEGIEDLAGVAAGIRLKRQILAPGPSTELIAGEWPVSAQANSAEALADKLRCQVATLSPHQHLPRGQRCDGGGRSAAAGARRRGLWMADASVVPKMVSGNTNAPVILVAERAAETMLAAA